MLSSVVDFVVELLNWKQKLPCQGREPVAEIDELFFSLMRVMPLHQGVGLAWVPYPQGEGEWYQGHHLLWKVDQKTITFKLNIFIKIIITMNTFLWNAGSEYLVVPEYAIVV